jgi:hypothetical protein
MKYIKKFNKSRKRFTKFVEFKDFCVFENKLYNKSTIISTTNRIGDDSDDTLNKLAISGLYRTKFGDIQQIKSKKQLDSLFDEWYNETINGLVKTPEFIDNKELVKKYLDVYVNNIRSLGDNAQPFSLKKIKTGLIDLVNNNNWIKDDNFKQSFDIYNPKKEDVLYEDKNIVILNTNTKAKCVMYGVGESWCISKSELNKYNTYRVNFETTPYFVLQKNEKHPVHKLVIMNYGNGYAIADQTNTGDKDGNKEFILSWEQIEKEIPNLKGLEKYFMYKEVNDDEKRYEEIISKSINFKGDDLQGFIDDSIKNLVINGSQVDSVDFIRDFSNVSGKITDEQIKSLRTEVCDSLIESGYFLKYREYRQSDLLSPKQRLRVSKLKVKKNIPLVESEFSTLSKNDQDRYLSNLSDYGIELLLISSRDPFDTKKLLGKKGDKILSKLERKKKNTIFIGGEKNINFSSVLDTSSILKYLTSSPNPDMFFDLLINRYPNMYKKLKIEDLIKCGLSKNKLMEIYGENFNKIISD